MLFAQPKGHEERGVALLIFLYVIPNLIQIIKFQGSSEYPRWRRFNEINLA